MSLFCWLTALGVLISVPKSDFAAYLLAVKKRAADANLANLYAKRCPKWDLNRV
jgi:hypothetical protein